jgi:hypothetical protein
MDFIIQFLILPRDLEDFVVLVVSILQRRGLFRLAIKEVHYAIILDRESLH